jgi:hypothetical protein
MPAPESYGDVGMVIKVDPDNMWRQAVLDLPTHAQNIGGHISTVVDTWNNLRLGWVGNT